MALALTMVLVVLIPQIMQQHYMQSGQQPMVLLHFLLQLLVIAPLKMVIKLLLMPMAVAAVPLL
jgi:hypothetical protein